MADEPTPPPVESATDPAPPAAPAVTPPPDPSPAELGDAGKRALDAERAARRALESQLKELQPLADQARKAAEASKTAEQKLTEKAATAEAQAATAAAELARLRAAMSAAPAGMGFDEVEKMAKRLNGATPEELAADAAELFTLFTPPTTTTAAGPVNGRTPVENLRPAGLPANPELSLADQVAAAEKAGDVALSMRLKSIQLRDLATKSTT